MASEALWIVGVDRVNDDQVLVEFSDGTVATFTSDQLLSLHPNRTGREEPAPE